MVLLSGRTAFMVFRQSEKALLLVSTRSGGDQEPSFYWPLVSDYDKFSLGILTGLESHS